MKKTDEYLLENLSPVAVKELMEKIKRQSAEREDAIVLMLFFCDLVEKEKEIPKELLNHFKFCFESIVSGLPANRALGIEKSNNRPKANEKKCIHITLEVFRHRLNGKSANIASELVAAKYGLNPSTIKKYWGMYKEDAFAVESIKKYEEGLRYSKSELDKINKILKRKTSNFKGRYYSQIK